MEGDGFNPPRHSKMSPAPKANEATAPAGRSLRGHASLQLIEPILDDDHARTSHRGVRAWNGRQQEKPLPVSRDIVLGSRGAGRGNVVGPLKELHWSLDLQCRLRR